MIILKNKPIKTVFHFFSVLVVSFFSITGCTVKGYPITTENDIQPLKEQNQVIIAYGTNSKTDQNIIEQNTTEQPQQQNPPQKEEQTNTTIKTSQKEQTDISSQKNSNSSSFLNWGESNSQYWAKLETVAKAASSFYKSKAAEQTLLSKEGKLYNNSTASYVTTSFLSENGYLENTFSDFYCDILLLKSSDIAAYIETKLPSSVKEVDIFTATKQPSGSKIMLCSTEGKITSLSQEQYRQLFQKYNTYHGRIAKLSPQMEEYERILNFIRVYEGNYDQYYVRDIRADEKYAVVTFSSQSTPNNVKQYVLINEDGFWEVAIDDLDKKSNLHYAVNSVLPDFNLSLLPPYNVYFYKNDMKADFSDVLKHMITYELIQQQSQVQYKCGTANYCYMVLYGGERYLGKKVNENWDIWKVKSAEDAISAMELDNQNAPTFIVLDE